MVDNGTFTPNSYLRCLAFNLIIYYICEATIN
nr:MAG TPA: hypothetical protein [Caudoviricetes sp.]